MHSSGSANRASQGAVMPSSPQGIFGAAEMLLAVDHIHHPTPHILSFCFHLDSALPFPTTITGRSCGLHPAENLSPLGPFLHQLCLVTYCYGFSRPRLRCYFTCTDIY